MDNLVRYRFILGGFLIPLLKVFFAIFLLMIIILHWEQTTPTCHLVSNTPFQTILCIATSPVYGYLILVLIQITLIATLSVPNMTSIFALIQRSTTWTPTMRFYLNVFTLCSFISLAAQVYPYYMSQTSTSKGMINIDVTPDTLGVFILAWATLLAAALELLGFVAINYLLVAASLTRSLFLRIRNKSVDTVLLPNNQPQNSVSVQMERQTVYTVNLTTTPSDFPNTFGLSSGPAVE